MYGGMVGLESCAALLGEKKLCGEWVVPWLRGCGVGVCVCGCGCVRFVIGQYMR